LECHRPAGPGRALRDVFCDRTGEESGQAAESAAHAVGRMGRGSEGGRGRLRKERDGGAMGWPTKYLNFT